MCFTCEYTCSSTTSIIYAVAGIKNTNLNIRCYDLSVDPSYNGYFWKINGSVYGALHLPREYEVCSSRCNLAILTIPVVLAEMDGYTFQCFGINYQTNTVLEGTVTELNVTVLSGDFTGELFRACIHGYMFLIIMSIFRKSSCHSRWCPGV